jgi:hypothetical protein
LHTLLVPDDHHAKTAKERQDDLPARPVHAARKRAGAMHLVHGREPGGLDRQQDAGLAVDVMELLREGNVRAKGSKTYHLVISLHPEDRRLTPAEPLSPWGACSEPNCAVLNIMSRGAPRRQGLCFYYSLNLRKDLHELTRTYRNPNVDRGLSLRTHLARDVMDVRRILLDAGYDPRVVRKQLRELIRQNKGLWRQVEVNEPWGRNGGLPAWR